MPTYTYRCAGCRHQFDTVQAIREKIPPACPACGGLTESIIQGKRVVLSISSDKLAGKSPDKAASNGETPPGGHSCGPSCALHHIDAYIHDACTRESDPESHPDTPKRD